MSAPVPPPAASPALADALLAALFTQSPFSVGLYDAAGHVALANAAYERLWGISLAEVPADYSLRTDPQLAADGVLPLIERAYSGEAVVLPPVRYDAARATGGSGRAVWTQGHCVPVRDGAGVVTHVAIIHEDVTADVEARMAQARQRRVAEASAMLGGTLDVDETLRRFAATAVAAVGDWCVIDLIDRDAAGEVVRVRRAAVAHADPSRRASLEQLARDYPPNAARPTLARNVIATGRGELVPSVSDETIDRVAVDAEQARLIREIGMRSYVVVPLEARGRLLGVAVFVSAGATLDEADLAVAEELGRRAALAVDNARLFTAEREARAAAESAAVRAGALQAVTSALVGARAADDVATAVLGAGMRALGAERGALGVVSNDGRWVEVVGTRGYPESVATQFRRVSIAAEFPLAEVARTGEPVLLETAAERDARFPGLAALRQLNGVGAMAALPLATADRVLGAIGLNFEERRAFSDVDRAFMTALAQQCAQALERVRLDEEVRAARAAAEAASRAKSEFLAVMSHELRTPLNAIGGYAELLELGIRGPITSAQRDDLARIQKSQRHLLRLINEVLNYARLEAGALTYEIVDVRVADVVAAAEALVAPQLEARRLTCATSADDGAGGDGAAVTVRADRDKLQQILLNLLSNAVKFTEATPSRPGRVEVSWATSEDGDAARRQSVRITVRDTGVGIAPDKLDAIFEPFVQVNTSLTRTTEGTGLGLAISRDLARGMGGDLKVHSVEGEGSAFTVTLPKGGEVVGGKR
ncbi:MAG TPA: ATP-binding protein [Gemmatimonadaceae bacterium]|nr:ATP-binding protein [Gemmatimonadaceae bacterium]